MINYQKEGDIFVVTFSGAIPFDDIIAYLSDFSKIKHLPRNINILYNFTKADFDLDPVKIKIISDKAIEVTERYESIRTAFVISEPKVTAYTMLFSLLMPNEKSSREIFSTISAARDWLKGFR